MSFAFIGASHIVKGCCDYLAQNTAQTNAVFEVDVAPLGDLGTFRATLRRRENGPTAPLPSGP
jgi:hypothetical protein